MSKRRSPTLRDYTLQEVPLTAVKAITFENASSVHACGSLWTSLTSSGGDYNACSLKLLMKDLPLHRIDQKTCAKCVVAAGLQLVVIPMALQGDQLCTDMDCLKAEVRKLGSANVVAVLSTTSCFAPRAADRLVEIAKFCAEEDIGHVVNNAYGVQV